MAWSYFLVLWEKVDFRFSAESQLSAIMSWIFQAPYNKIDYSKNIYGALADVTKELEEKLGQQGQSEGSVQKEEVVEMTSKQTVPLD